ncbi:MAG: hypothetical protein K2X69_12980 [Silvanigrellaceae bacterium]|nr:hypothetical protein [Silvanigrellaceae bacterium]
MFETGHAINTTAELMNRSCWEIFVNAVYLENKKTYQNQYNELVRFAKSSCKTSNPDVIWSISKVESNFNFNILGVAGKEVVTDKEKIQHYFRTSDSKRNFDIGPMQINWRYHVVNSGYPANYFLDGEFSVNYISNKILSNIVKKCQNNWISCYHSAKSAEGLKYKKLIYNADIKLRKNLNKMLAMR